MDISFINYRQLASQPELRSDARYWKESFLQNEMLIQSNCSINSLVEPLNSIVKVREIIHPFEYLEINGVELNSTNYVTNTVQPNSAPSRATYILKRGDIAVSTVRPNRNCVSLIQQDGIIASSGFTILRPKYISSEYLWTFCKTNYFRMYLNRRQRNTMYPAVSSKDILNCPIFNATKSLQNKIEKDIRKSVSTLEKLTKEYHEAKNEFQLYLEFNTKKYDSKNIFIGNIKDVNSKKRMDVSYYNPIYKRLKTALKTAEKCVSLRELLLTCEKGIEVGSKNYVESGFPFLRVSNVNTFNLTQGEYVSKQTYYENRSNNPRRGEILLSKDATLGLVHYIDYNIEPMLVCSGIVRLKLKKSFQFPYYLTMVLDSQITKLQLLRESNGTILRHLSVASLNDVIIPLLTEYEMEKYNCRLKDIFKKIKQTRQIQNKIVSLLNAEILLRK